MLNETLEICRELYNSLLSWRKHDYELYGKFPTYHEQRSAFQTWRKQNSRLKSVNNGILRNVLDRVDAAFRSFNKREKLGQSPGLPRFKSSSYDSFAYEGNVAQVDESCKSIRLSLFQSRHFIKAKIHRPPVGTIKNCTIAKQKGKWFACFTIDVVTQPLASSNECVGIDVGIEKFASLSNGEFVENPRFFRKEEKSLNRAANRRNSANSLIQKQKAKKVVDKINGRLINRRRNFAHQVTKQLVDKYGMLSVEKLRILGLMRSKNLKNSIANVSWNRFRCILKYKAEKAGRLYIEVNPKNTSQMCSGCQNAVKKNLQERWHLCPFCGLSLDRDTNAAINILTLGQQCIAGSPA